MEGAGFTDVFVTGMPTKWINVKARGVGIGRTQDYDQETRRQNDFGQESGAEPITAQRKFEHVVTILAEYFDRDRLRAILDHVVRLRDAH